MTDLRIIKGKEMKKNIIFSTLKLIAEEGIEGISTQKIADHLNISKSNIFHHFKSVDIILDEVFATILQSMLEPISSHNYKNVKEFLMFIGKGVYQLIYEERTIYIVMFQLYTMSLHNEKYQNLILRQKEKIIQVISSELSKLTDSDKDTCETVSEILLMSLDGYGLSALLDERPPHYERLWELNVDYLCNLLSESKGGSYD
ncbi:MAG: TetR/AcrR family transcriptional regulator [Erysipelothrix sp.]|nr:TetR/AcrR family transcriptional regulator [Erysipelothrix sp.]